MSRELRRGDNGVAEFGVPDAAKGEIELSGAVVESGDSRERGSELACTSDRLRFSPAGFMRGTGPELERRAGA